MTAKKKNGKQANCPSAEDITAYLREEFELVSKDVVKSHLESCPDCQTEAKNLTNTISLLKKAETIQPSRDLTPSIISEIDKDNIQVHHIFALSLKFAATLAIILNLTFIAYRVTANRGSKFAEIQQEAREEGLLWLVAAQDQSGKWTPDQWGGKEEYTVGLTGMALLSLSRSDDDFPEKNTSINKAATFLLSQQKNDGMLGKNFDGTMYNHSIATVALLETYQKNKNPELETPIKKAIRFIEQQQLPSGGWGYSQDMAEEANTSISIWPLQALLLSSQLGWKAESHSLERGLSWLGSIVDPAGNFGYQQFRQAPHGSSALTAMGAYCLFSASKTGIKIDEQKLTQIKNALAADNSEKSSSDFYRNYFEISALEASGINQSKALKTLHAGLITKRQASGDNQGSWAPDDQWGSVGGRIYSTAMASMSL